jgi:outer membrane protein assembly factor BamB
MHAVITLTLGLLVARAVFPEPAPPTLPAGSVPSGAERLQWRFVTGGRVLTKPALSGRGTIYIVSEDRHLYALAADGTQRWRLHLGRRPSAGPVVASDGTILVGTETGQLVAVRPNGRPQFRFDAGAAEPMAEGSACLTPALGRDGSIYLPVRAGVVFCLDYRGRLRWRYRTRSELTGSPAVGPDGTVLVGTADRRLLALDPLGRLLWELELPGPVGAAAIGPDGTAYVGAAGLHAVGPTGVLRWSYPLAAATADPVIGPGDRVVVGAANGRLYAFGSDGRRVWELALRVPVRRAAVAGEDAAVYVGTDSQTLYAVSPGGRPLWRFEAKQAVGYPALAVGGTLIMGAEDWIVYALGSDSGGPAPTAWPELYHDGQNTGRAGAPADLDGPAAMALRELARSGSAELQQVALRDIQAHLRGERYLGIGLAGLEEILGLLAAGGILSREVQHGAGPPVSWPIRREACRLLGVLGSDGSSALLLQLLVAAEEPAVRTEALNALAGIGLDPQGELGRAILYTVAQGSQAAAGSDLTLLAAASALHAVVVGGGSHPDDLRALAVLATGDYPEAVKRRASAYLIELSQRWER